MTKIFHVISFFSGKDWIMVGMSDGKLKFEISFGYGKNLILRSNERMNDGNEHKAVLTLNKKATLMIDDDSSNIIESTNDNIDDYFNVKQTSLYIGGHKKNIPEVTGSEYQEGFRGCLLNVGFQHKRNPGESGPASYGSSSIAFSNKALYLEMMGVKCVKFCSV